MALRLDPTRTTTLRAQYSAEMRRRFNELKKLVFQALVEQDALGLETESPLILQEFISNQLPERQAWRFQTNAQKLNSFNVWFRQQVDERILEVDIKGDPWTAKYVGSAYRRGSLRAYMDTRPEAMAESLEFYRGRREQFLESAFAQPERISKLQFLYTRSFEDLKGITSQMANQVSRIMASGLANGKGARTIAREISNSITAITKKRALVMARTEIIAAHAEGQLDSFEELGVEFVGLMAEWSTASEGVCELCKPLNGVIMTIEEARGLIPRHPNCRCAWVPANVGEKKQGKKRFWTKRDKSKQISKSLKAELPKKTRAGRKVPQTVKTAKRRSTWAGKEKELETIERNE
jgi:SPP1 gp7 family putative phage head morphogenesis protein